MDDERPMRRAIEIARGPAFTSPNPRVGAVLVRDGRILSEGAHEGAGTPHAEAVAIAGGGDVSGATCYVTLEPCSHHGRMPPCAPAIVEAGITRVVAAIEDPDPRVSGGGVAYLRDRGVEVVVGVLEREASDLNAPYLHHRRTGRPLVTLKLALTLDGRAAAADGSSRWITGAESRREVHRRRREVDAVMVGAGTVVTDDPSLTVRDVPATRQPARVVLDPSGRVDPSARVFSDEGEVIVLTTERSGHDRHVAWKEAGAEIVVLPEKDGRVDLGALVERFATTGWLEVMCEGGGELATALLRADLVDRLELYTGPVLAGSGGPDIGDLGIATLDAAPRFRLVSVDRFENDIRAMYVKEIA